MKKEYSSTIVNTIASLTPALVQIFAFLAIELSNVFKLKDIFLYSEALTIVNFIVLLMSIYVIAIYSHWKANYFQVTMQQPPPSTPHGGAENNPITKQEYFRW